MLSHAPGPARRIERTERAALAMFLAGALAQAAPAAPPAPASIYEPPLSFRDDRDRPVELAAFGGRRAVVTMFYSECTSRCAMTLSVLRKVADACDARGDRTPIVMVSFDARGESASDLARFREREGLDARWHLLSGEAAAVDALATRLGLGGFMDLGDHFVHGFRIVLVEADGSIARAIDWDHRDVDELLDGPRRASPPPDPASRPASGT